MAWGIIIGVALTVLTVVLAMLFGKKELTPISYIIIIVVLVAFSLEGIKYINAVEDKKDFADKVNNMVAIAETAITYTGSDIQNFRLGMAEATAVRTALRFAYPKAVKYFEPSDLIGKTLYECTEVLRVSVIRSANSRIWESVSRMIGILIIAILLIVLSMNIGVSGRRRNISSIDNDESYSSSDNDESYSSSRYEDF